MNQAYLAEAAQQERSPAKQQARGGVLVLRNKTGMPTTPFPVA